MKKIISVLIVCLMFLCSCGKKEEGYYLTYNNKKLELEKEFTIADYGQYNDSFENASCAFGDKDITYFYDGVEVETYGKDNKLIVYSIRITDENTKNDEGIGLYDEISDVIKVYGEKYEKNDNKYTFTKGNSALIFITQNDIIESIEYRTLNID